ncbi:uncharacterized protein LOC142537491 [Primulina tabacum]|uniref:uncharacterized protein LOC142537491 n=1 Tax=Primulina tabacum TaxID=48773 RepID=UPI003F5A650B
MGTKIEVDRFDGKRDFGLWRRRMYAILVQQKVAKALLGEKKLPDTLDPKKKDGILELAFSTLTLNLDDKVLREVSIEKTAAGIWSKLESLYMTKSLQDRIHFKGEAETTQEGYESGDVLCTSNCKSDNCWILDSGCSFHLSPNKDWFETFNESNGGQVMLGNNKSCRVNGSGTIRLRLSDGTEKLLHELRYVPELKRNLISLGTLDQMAYTFKAANGILIISRGSMIYMKGT